MKNALSIVQFLAAKASTDLLPCTGLISHIVRGRLDPAGIAGRFLLRQRFQHSILDSCFRNNDCERDRTMDELVAGQGLQSVPFASVLPLAFLIQEGDTMKPAIAKYLKERRVAPRVGEERFIRLGEVLATCGKSRSSVYAGIKEGTFPAPIKLQGRSSAWLRSEVLRWMQACIEASRPASTASSAIEHSSGSRHIGNKGTRAE
ncbi:helix-turn-helix transcriptional regulator [Janthinobacterium psychrotolerans]|nr:AlpA family transcriptional regulator [Janthinobacterium psychrotolerans]